MSEQDLYKYPDGPVLIALVNKIYAEKPKTRKAFFTTPMDLYGGKTILEVIAMSENINVGIAHMIGDLKRMYE